MKINKDFFKSKSFLLLSSIIFISSLALAGGTVVFYAGEINGQVTIADTTTAVYDILIDGETCPTTINDIISMQSDSTYEIQHNIKNNEGFAINVEFIQTSVDTGLNIDMLDGTLSPTTIINIPANSNKWLVLRYNSDAGLSTGTVLDSSIQVKITPA